MDNKEEQIRDIYKLLHCAALDNPELSKTRYTRAAMIDTYHKPFMESITIIMTRYDDLEKLKLIHDIINITLPIFSIESNGSNLAEKVYANTFLKIKNEQLDSNIKDISGKLFYISHFHKNLSASFIGGAIAMLCSVKSDRYINIIEHLLMGAVIYEDNLYLSKIEGYLSGIADKLKP